MRRPALLLAAALGLACQPPPSSSDADADADEASPAPSPSTPTPTTTEPAPDPVPPACSVPPLHAELSSYCDYDLGIPPIALPRVPWTAPSYHPLATQVITLDDSGLTDPEGTQGTVSIEQWLAEPPRQLAEPGELVFGIAATVPAATVAQLWRGLADAGREHIHVLVHVAESRPVPQPRNPKMLAGMRDALPEGKAQRMMFAAKGIMGYAETCPSLADVFGEFASVAEGERCQHFATLASAAVVECQCPRLPEIMTLLYALTMGFQPPLGRAAAVSIRLDPAQPIAITAGETWGRVAASALADTSVHALWIEP